MTLKEKFDSVILCMNYKDCAKQEDLCEQIADDYAIEFVDWLDLDETQDLIYSLQIVGELPKLPKTKELLEQFKKQKGL